MSFNDELRAARDETASSREDVYNKVDRIVAETFAAIDINPTSWEPLRIDDAELNGQARVQFTTHMRYDDERKDNIVATYVVGFGDASLTVTFRARIRGPFHLFGEGVSLHQEDNDGVVSVLHRGGRDGALAEFKGKLLSLARSR